MFSHVGFPWKSTFFTHFLISGLTLNSTSTIESTFFTSSLIINLPPNSNSHEFGFFMSFPSLQACPLGHHDCSYTSSSTKLNPLDHER